MTTSLDEIQGLLAEWEQAKAAVPAAAQVIAREQDLRKKVIATVFPTDRDFFAIRMAKKFTTFAIF